MVLDPINNQQSTINNQRMSNKKISISIMVVVLLLLLGLIFFVFFYDFRKVKVSQDTSSQSQEINQKQQQKEEDNPAPESEKTKEPQEVSVKENSSSSVQLRNKQDLTKIDLKNMASSFAERFGSYSNHSDFNNIKNLEIFMTDSMRSWAQNMVEQERSKKSSGEYHGITTNAIASNLQKFDKDGGEVKVEVVTQRRESQGEQGNIQTYRQNLTLTYVKREEGWKVDEAFWGEKQE